MNVKKTLKGDRKKEYENAQRNLPLQSVTQKPLAFHNVLKPNLPLSDKSEFPSLNEISGKVPHYSQSGEELSKYSDKLKLHSSAQNQSSISSFIHLKNDTVLTDSYKDYSHNAGGSHVSNKWFRNGLKHSSNEKESSQTNSQNEPNKPSIVNKRLVNSSQNIPKGNANFSLKESQSSKYNENKNQFPKQKHIANASNSLSHSTHKMTVINSNCTSHNSKSSNQTQSKHEQKANNGSNPVAESNDASGNTIVKKKKKRKSKVKRQVALQTGKITVLTPEVHSKILNQTSALISQNFKSVLTDINDEEEYPELGKPLIPTTHKENYPKKEHSTSQPVHEAVHKRTDASADKESLASDIVKDFPVVTFSKSDGKLATEKKEIGENKVVIHPNDPITMSFYDILVNKNFKAKVKSFEVEDDTSPTIPFVKAKMKKNSSQPHNFLDSSAPAIKRGKERENPKPKKPSHLKKIILLDRKVRKEQLLQLKDNTIVGENALTDNEYEQIKETENNEVDSPERNILLEKNCENSSSNTLTFQLELQEENNHLLQLEDFSLCLPDDLKFPTKIENISETDKTQKSEVTSDILSSIIIPAEEFNVKPFSEEASINTYADNVSVNEEVDLVQYGTAVDSSVVEKSNMNVLRSDLLLDSLKNHDQKLNSSDREKAVKILLHTRNFREYCNHLISKDIDDVVLALLDDLARFQDRLHQKDPVKARMKRRMIYGVKEVKKHIKLKKLKSIVIAADIENVEAQGGLNDFLNDIKSLASDHHIPCVFALSRKVLGKVCRKPVPVSCVGVFNYEGSEANFKKMVELQTQSKIDYIEICSKLSESLTDDQISTLLKAKKEAPEALSSIRRNILGDFFMESKAAIGEQEKADLKSEEASNLSDIEV